MSEPKVEIEKCADVKAPSAPATPDSDTIPPEAQNREACLKERDDAFESIQKSQEEFDKQLLTLSTGLLAVMLAFVKDVVPLNQEIHLPLLYTSGGLLGSCILFVLISFRISIIGHFKAMAYWEAQINGQNKKFPFGYTRVVRGFNELSGALFFSGVICCLLFVGLNLNHGAQMARDRINEGREIKPPSPGDVEKRGQNIKVPVSSPKPASTPSTNNPPANTSTENK
jgi:hypothetical protein